MRLDRLQKAIEAWEQGENTEQDDLVVFGAAQNAIRPVSDDEVEEAVGYITESRRAEVRRALEAFMAGRLLEDSE